MRVLLVVAIAALATCNRTAPADPTAGETAVQSATARPRVGAPGGAEDAGPTEPEPPGGGLHGLVRPVDDAPPARVLVFRPGEPRPVWTGLADERGRFHAPDLAPETYRVILPGDGVHSTADAYLTVAPADAGPSEPAVVHRSRGCRVTATFRSGAADAGGPPVAGAEVELVMPELDGVDERLTVRATTDEGGRVTALGTCVRGFIDGTVRVPGLGLCPFRHGYLGGGHDEFEIGVVEAPDGGCAGSPGSP